MASDSPSDDRFPRLHLAWRQERHAYTQRRFIRARLLANERLVAHRELELIRAMNLRKPRRTVERRRRLLHEARTTLNAVRDQADRLEVE